MTTTKYDVGEKVLVEAKVVAIEITGNSIRYNVTFNGSDRHFVEENQLADKRGCNKS